MNIKQLVDLKKEIDHIFESGANEIRILEMVDKFVSRRFVDKELYEKAYEDGYSEAAKEACEEINKNYHPNR